MAGILGQGYQQPGILGGMQPQMPRIPFAQNPIITTLAASLMAGRTPREGLANFGAALPGAAAVKLGMQRDLSNQQAEDARKAQMNEVMKAWPGLSPEQRALFSAQPELFGQYALDSMKPKEVDPTKGLMEVDGMIYDAARGEWITPPDGMGGDIEFNDVGGLRKEIQALPSYKNTAQAVPIFKAMVSTYPNKTRASDLNLVYGLGKIMDPTSVVREGEMIMVKDTASLPDWFLGEINRVNGGAALQEDTRKAILAEAKTRMDAYMQQWDTDVGQYRGIAQRYQIPEADVLPSFGQLPDLPFKSSPVNNDPLGIR